MGTTPADRRAQDPGREPREWGEVMETERRPTVASEIALPPALPEHLLVELADLKTKDGGPVYVGCDRPDPLHVLERYGLPGTDPKDADANSPAARMRRVSFVLNGCADLVHRYTSLGLADGTTLRPAFHCDEAHAVSHSIPWDRVTLNDKLAVVNALLRLGGFGGAAAAEFPAQG